MPDSHIFNDCAAEIVEIDIESIESLFMDIDDWYDHHAPLWTRQMYSKRQWRIKVLEHIVYRYEGLPNSSRYKVQND